MLALYRRLYRRVFRRPAPPRRPRPRFAPRLTQLEGRDVPADLSLSFNIPDVGVVRWEGNVPYALIDPGLPQQLIPVGTVSIEIDGQPHAPPGIRAAFIDGVFVDLLAEFGPVAGYSSVLVVDKQATGVLNGETVVLPGVVKEEFLPDLDVVVPGGSVTATATVPADLSVAVTSEAGVASVVWWASFENKPYEVIPGLTTATPTYAFPTYGEYDVWVVVTDAVGRTAVGGFHVSAAEFVPTAEVSVAGAAAEGEAAVFTAAINSPDPNTTATVLADWEGTGEFEQLNPDDFTVNADGTVSFGHVYTWAPEEASAFGAVIRVQNDSGGYTDTTIPVTITPVPPQAELMGGMRMGTEADSGLNVWAVWTGTNLSFPNVAVPAGHEEGLRYHWVLDGGAEVVTMDSFLNLPDYTMGKSYRVEAWVTDARGRESPHQVGVAAVHSEVYLPAFPNDPVADSWTTVGGDLLPFSVYGVAYIKEDGPPVHASPYVLGLSVGRHNWPADTPLTLKVDLDPATLAYAQSIGATIRYEFGVSIAGENGFPGLVTVVSQASPEFRFDGWPAGQSVYLGAEVHLVVNGVTLDDADNDGLTDYNRWTWYASFGVKTTPPPSTWDWIQSQLQSLRNLAEVSNQLAQRTGQSATTLVNALTDVNAVVQIGSTLKTGLEGAITQFATELTDPNKLLGYVYTWFFGGTLPTGFQSLDFGSADGQKLLNLGLEFAGLTWDHVYQVMIQQLGAGNLAAVEKVYGWLGGDQPLDPADPTSLVKLIDRLNADPDVGLEELKEALKSTVADAISQGMVRVAAQLAAKFVPGIGAINTLMNGLTWVNQNIGPMTEVFDKLVEGVDALVAGDAAGLQQKLVEGFRKAVGPMLNLASLQLGLGKVKDDLRNALGFIPKKVDAALVKAITKVAGKPAAQGGAGGGATGGLYAGKMAPERTFTHDGTEYVLWVAQQGNALKVKVVKKGGGTPVVVLTADKFDDTGITNPDGKTPTQHLADLADAAAALYGKTRRNPHQPPTKDTLPAMRAFQAAVAAAEDKVVADIVASACVALNAGCFAAGTKLLTRAGWRAVEDIRDGDEVLSRDENDPAAPAEWKPVEKTFRRTGRVLELRVVGEVIRTTPEHPFFVHGKGWTAAGAVAVGDRVATLSGEWAAVEGADDTGSFELVYNVRVADHHTYFVGGDGWAAAIWAHNAYTVEAQTAKKYNYESGSYVKVKMTGGSGGAYNEMWFRPNAMTDPNAIFRAARVDRESRLGDEMEIKAQEIADEWKNKPLEERYGNLLPAVRSALEAVNGYRLDAGLSALTLDQIDAGAKLNDLSPSPDGYGHACHAFWAQRASAIGNYVDAAMKDAFRGRPGLTGNSVGPDFTYTRNGRTALFEVLPNSPGSLAHHADRLRGAYWRTVLYTWKD